MARMSLAQPFVASCVAAGAIAFTSFVHANGASSPAPVPSASLSTSSTNQAPAPTPSAQGPAPYSPRIEPASDEPQRTMKGFRLSEGFTIDVYAAEPRVAHPVCFTIARDGTCYVAETFRHHAGVTDMRDHMDWLDEDVAARSVADRVAMYKKHLGDRFGTYETEHERVKLLRDTDGDGRIDQDTVFADGFHFAADGIGAGLLENDGDVYYTCIPNLWRLRDVNHDGRVDDTKAEREALSTGWGIRVALLGHDMHGLQIGPDGRLYWSIGDRGFQVVNREGDLLDSPFTGAVLRSELDGSKLEVFATGLRNPQELAFDDFGNLWTGDNNSDGGDEARLVQVIEAGETGWRQSYQWLVEPHLRGAWNDERLWLPHFDGQAAYVVPPIANVAHGPSGFACNPGTGLSSKWDRHFFLCDFEGATEWSGVISFTVEPKGASFTVSTPERFVWGPLATDCDFGVDGGLYVSDWVAGWNKTGKGRIWRVMEPDVVASAIVKETRALLADGMKRRDERELLSLLSHADRRARQAAHLELAARGDASSIGLGALARDPASPRLARLHAVWALGVIQRRGATKTTPLLVGLLNDADDEVRAQAAHVLGDLRAADAVDALVTATRDRSARVRMYAAIALARIGRERAFPALVELVRSTGQSDPPLRHAATYGLWNCATPQKITELIDHPSVDVRVAAVVALRRMHEPLIARFLDDADPRVRSEAARAIYDVPIPNAMDALAVQITREGFARFDVRVPANANEGAFQAGNGWVRRILNANFRAGRAENAESLAAAAGDATLAPLARVEALELLAAWTNPPGRDRFHGEWMPLDPRDGAVISRLVPTIGARLDDATPDDVLRAWIRLAASRGVRDVTPQLVAIARDAGRAADARADAIAALGEMPPEGVLELLESTLFDPAPAVRAATITAFLSVAPDRALPLLESALARSVEERRAAYQGLARLPQPRVDEILIRDLTELDAGRLPQAIALDVVEACEARSNDALKARLDTRSAPRRPDVKTANYLDALYGGDARRGRDVFRGKSALECLRCHTAENEGGIVGPNLKDLAKRSTRLAILESIVDPNRTFAAGYQGSIVFKKDETSVEGLVVEDVPDHVKLRRADGTEVVVPRAEIELVKPGLSAMPTNMSENLSRDEMRDLIEYLTTL